MKRIIALAALATMTAGAATVTAHADGDDRRILTAPRGEWMSMAEMSSRLEAKGYTIREIDIDDGYFDVELIDENGRRVDADFHPVTGEVLDWDHDD